MEPLGGGQRLQYNEIRVVAPGGCPCYFGRLCAADLFFFLSWDVLNMLEDCMLPAVPPPYHLRPALLACHAVRLGRLHQNQEEGREGIPASYEKKKRSARFQMRSASQPL